MEKNSEEFELYKAHADNYICSLMPGIPGYQAQYTPGQKSEFLIQKAIRKKFKHFSKILLNFTKKIKVLLHCHSVKSNCALVSDHPPDLILSIKLCHVTKNHHCINIIVILVCI